MCNKDECDADGWLAYVDWNNAVREMVDAKIAEATEFLRVKAAGKDRTDGTAARMAYVATGGAADIAQGRVDWLRARMGGGTCR